jgi:hypothetical protein
LLSADQTVSIFARIWSRRTIDDWIFSQANDVSIHLFSALLAVSVNANLALSLRAFLTSFFNFKCSIGFSTLSLDANLAVTFLAWVLDWRSLGNCWEVLASSGLLANLAFTFFALFTFASNADVANSLVSVDFTLLANLFTFRVFLADLALLSVGAWISRREGLEWLGTLLGSALLTSFSLADRHFTRLVFLASLADVSLGIGTTNSMSSIRLNIVNRSIKFVANLSRVFLRNNCWNNRIFVWFRANLRRLFFFREKTTELRLRVGQLGYTTVTTVALYALNLLAVLVEA